MEMKLLLTIILVMPIMLLAIVMPNPKREDDKGGDTPVS